MITAPYNFVPLSGWIFSPDWAEQVSHDMPFREGISGCIDIKITAETPILIGNESVLYDKKRPHQPGESHFCQINNRYAIPGTTLKGMIRNVLEIASFGKMHYTDNRRLGIRDISSKHVKDENYPINGQQAGFLRWREERKEDHKSEIVFEIVPCKFVHIEHPDMIKQTSITTPCLFTRGMSVKDKYQLWKRSAKSATSTRQLPLIRFDIKTKRNDETATNLGAGQIEGEIVFTGQISDKNETPKTGKYRDFVFYKRQENDIKKVCPRILADFRFIHGDSDKKHPGSWQTYWKEMFFKGGEIPVFYHVDGEQKIKSIGLAFMYKLAYECSIGETIDHTNPEHRKDNKPDLAEVMFGKIHPDAKKNELSLKSRVSFGTCFIENDNQPSPEGRTTILSGPKPTYFPNYVRQDKTPELSKNKDDTTYHYRTYMQYDSEIRGWKRYPVRLNKEVDVLPPPTQFGRTEREASVAAQIKLFPLPPQTTFSGKIRFHNLRPEELGALLWVLEWGGDARLRHNIGMGKPLGFGVIKLEITGGELRLNQNPTVPVSLEVEQRKKYHQKFEDLMNTTYQKAQKQLPHITWKQSEQLLLLRAMAWPEHGKAKNSSLRYMLMGNDNEFSQAKRKGWVLPEYQDIPEQQRDRVLFPRNHQPPPVNRIEKVRSPVETWLEGKIGEMPKKGDKDRLRWEKDLISKRLAEQWQELEEGAFKQQVLEYVRSQWQACTSPEVDWWNKPADSGMRKAKKIYTQN